MSGGVEARSLGSKLRRFAVVGVVNTAIDLAVFAIVFGLTGWPFISNLVAWAVAVTFSFAANSLWSFERDRGKPVAHSFFQFVSLGALIYLGVSNLSLLSLQAAIGVWPAKIVGVVVAAALNFAAAKWSIEGRLRR
jgi:putative flippase GtrA